MDIFLQMSSDSPFLTSFLESCSNETWFRTVAMVLRAPRQDNKLLERLSIVLQKLSKLRLVSCTFFIFISLYVLIFLYIFLFSQTETTFMTSFFPFHDDKTLPKWGLVLKERLCSHFNPLTRWKK